MKHDSRVCRGRRGGAAGRESKALDADPKLSTVCSLLWLCILLLLPIGALADRTSFLDAAGSAPLTGLGERAWVLTDYEGDLALDAVVRDPELPWAPRGETVLNLSFSDSVYWIRFGFQNSSDQTVQRLFEVATPLQDYLDLYVVQDGQLRDVMRTGDRRPFDSRPINHRNFLFPLEIDPGSQLELYLRVDTHDGMYEALPFALWPEEAFFVAAQRQALSYGLYYGALLVLLAYNFLLWISTRERVFILYVCYLSAFFVWNFTLQGYAFQFWWPQLPALNNQMLVIGSVLIYVSLTFFTLDYLNLRARAPWAAKLLLSLAAMIALVAVPGVLGSYAASFMLLVPMGITFLLSMYGIAVMQTLRGYRPARFFLLAWTVLVIGAVLYYLRMLGLVPASFITENALQIGSALEFVLLAFGLADKINLLKAQRLKAEQAAHDYQRRLAEGLEHRVRERTLELEQLNEHLEQMVVTDDLTGLHNRRYFNERFELEFNRCRRHGQLFAFSIMDVDRFKEFNDSVGHRKGDEVLCEVAGVLLTQLRRGGDQVFRIGGEEFGILLDAGDPDEAQARLEAIRLAVAAMNISHPSGVVTASFGLVCITGYDGVGGAQRAYLEADAALYDAKGYGRNRVIVRTVSGRAQTSTALPEA